MTDVIEVCAEIVKSLNAVSRELQGVKAAAREHNHICGKAITDYTSSLGRTSNAIDAAVRKLNTLSAEIHTQRVARQMAGGRP